MKQDKLEHFIRDYSDELNEDVDVDKLWSDIKPKLHNIKKKKVIRVYRVAAVLFLLMAAGIVFFSIRMNTMNADSDLASNSEAELAQIQYASLIEIKRNEINSFRDKEPELCKEFDSQLIELDNMYNDLSSQINDANKKEIVLQAMIENLQMQLNILSKQLEIVQQVNEKKNEKNETLEL
jgi:TolA-binding protein